MQSTQNTAEDKISRLTSDLSSISSSVDEIKKNFETILNPAKLFAEAIVSTTEGAEALDRNMLLARSRIIELRYAVGDALPKIDSLGGGLEDVARTIADTAAGSRRNVVESEETIEKLYATSRVLGKSVESIVTSFGNIGIQSANIGKNVESSINYVRSMGLNAHVIMSDVLNNMEMMNRYHFDGGVQGLTKMAAQASMLKFDMKQTFDFADKVIDPDKAIEFAGVFQRLGLATEGLGNPFKLMNDALMNPAGLQDSLIKMTSRFVKFNDKTKSFEISPMGIMQMRELEKAGIGSAREMAKTAIASADLGERMSKIKLNIPKEDKEFLANIAYMDTKTGEYKVKLVDEITGSQEIINLNKINTDQLQKLREQQERTPKTMEGLAQSSLSTQESIASFTRQSKDYLGILVTGNANVATNVEGLQRIIKTAPRTLLNAFERDPNLKTETATLGQDIFGTLQRLMSGPMDRRKTESELSKMETRFEKDFNKLTSSAKEDFKQGLVDISKTILPQTGIERAFLEKMLYPLMKKLGLETPNLPSGPTLLEKNTIRESKPLKIREEPVKRIQEAPLTSIREQKVGSMETNVINAERINVDYQDNIKNILPQNSVLMLDKEKFFEGIKKAFDSTLDYYSASPQLSVAAVKMDEGFKKGAEEAHKEALKPSSEKISTLSQKIESRDSTLVKNIQDNKKDNNKVTTRTNNFVDKNSTATITSKGFEKLSSTKETETQKPFEHKTTVDVANLIPKDSGLMLNQQQFFDGIKESFASTLDYYSASPQLNIAAAKMDEGFRKGTEESQQEALKPTTQEFTKLSKTITEKDNTINVINKSFESKKDITGKNLETSINSISNFVNKITDVEKTLTGKNIENSITKTSNLVDRITDVEKTLTGKNIENSITKTSNLVDRIIDVEKTLTGKNIENSVTNTDNLVNRKSDVEKILTGKNIENSITKTSNLVDRIVDIEKILMETYRNSLNQTNFVNNNTTTVTPESRIGSKNLIVPKKQVNQDSDLVRSLNIPKEVTEKVINNSEIFLTDTIVKFFEKNIQNNNKTINSIASGVGSKLDGFNNVVQNREQIVTVRPESQPIVQPINAQNNPTLNGIQTITQNQNVTEKIDNKHIFQGQIDINLTGLNTDDKMKKVLFDILNSPDFAKVIYEKGKSAESNLNKLRQPLSIQSANATYGLNKT